MSRPSNLPVWLAAIAVVLGIAFAARLVWTCDDAFITFRYCKNLLAGHGVVFNPGEYVEGYSNFLWMLWSALGMALGRDVEQWTCVSGLILFGGTLLLLARNFFVLRPSFRPEVALVPIAVVLAAAHEDLCAFATSGLETSLFTFLVVAGYCTIVWTQPTTRRLVLAGACFGLAALTRPDGVIFGALACCFVAITSGVRRGIVLGLPIAALFGSFLLWRFSYYGEWVPNTYYAKSAHEPWWGQGWIYVKLYFEKYWALAAVPLLGYSVFRFLRSRPGELGPVGRQLLLASLFAVGFTVYVMRVGGDFMFGRFLVPVTPFYLIVFEICVLGAWSLSARGRIGVVATAALAAGAFLVTPKPVTASWWVAGITDERDFYHPSDVWSQSERAVAERVAPLFAGLDVSVSYGGCQARLMFYSNIRTAVESMTGLTDYELARKRVTERGRVGHEKKATVDDLIANGAHLEFVRDIYRELWFDTHLPLCYVRFGDVDLRVIHWDDALMKELERRGAEVTDIRAMIDETVAKMDELKPGYVTRQWDRYKRFYFDHNDDPQRRRPFDEWLVAREATARPPR